MKKLLSALLVTLVTVGGFSQDTTAFSWNVTSERKEPGVYLLTFTTDIRNNWQLFAPGQDISGIISAAVLFGDSSIRLEQALQAVGPVKKEKIGLFGDEVFSVQEGQAVWSLTIRIPGEVPGKLLGTIQYTYGKGDEFYPGESFPFEVSLSGGVQVENRMLLETVDLKAPLADCATGSATSDKQESSLWNIFFLGFLGGLVALLTPCVFPMIPLTVSFFTKRAKSMVPGMRFFMDFLFS